ncbi:MAG: hypothetical protein A3F84_07860 [Candidatus Handelsmanbacteria bacterium RIFCSPLOWO2_12_FULL_64_10]|uniref:Uncharacterized protein n=1 Tax=Handelsmanbacteria sp. (strain RIFCSPLOWO2_12_FULL_64_10) TaxID=1817868 RepID=A0A1F6CBC3_HANXR|nr:MAG: hypothetical protein A3F84_07860 [Candidatus Handelsmanbacteria bacterium RIFCSPLOWO2_12_FULL_64_10]
MDYGKFTEGDGIIMELAALRGVAGVLNEFGQFNPEDDEHNAIYNGLGVLLFGIAHRIEQHVERATWPEAEKAA